MTSFSAVPNWSLCAEMRRSGVILGNRVHDELVAGLPEPVPGAAEPSCGLEACGGVGANTWRVGLEDLEPDHAQGGDVEAVVEGEQGRFGGQAASASFWGEEDEELGGADLVVDEQRGESDRLRFWVALGVVDGETELVQGA